MDHPKGFLGNNRLVHSPTNKEQMLQVTLELYSWIMKLTAVGRHLQCQHKTDVFRNPAICAHYIALGFMAHGPNMTGRSPRIA